MQVTLSSIKIFQIYNELLNKYPVPSETVVVTSDDYFSNYKIEKILVSDIKKIAEACDKSGYVTSDWMETSFPSNISWSRGFSFCPHSQEEVKHIEETGMFPVGFAKGLQAAWGNCYYLSRRRYEPIMTKIMDAPVEHTEEQITYRILSSVEAISTKGLASAEAPRQMDNTHRYNGVMAVAHMSALYNFLDKGNYLLFYRRHSVLVPIVLNDVSYDIYKLLVLISLLGRHLGANPLEDTHYLNINIKRDFIRTSVLRLEAQLSKLTNDGNQAWEAASTYSDYFAFSKSITAFLMLNAKNQLYSQLLAGEISSFKLDDLEISKERISYENISVEYPELAHTLRDRIIYHNGRNNELALTIYDVVDEVVRLAVKTLQQRTVPKYDEKDNVIGLANDFSCGLTINGMPIILSVCTKDTRRRVNGFRINNSELIDVLKQSTCYRDAVQYNLFLRDVQNMSLLARKALTNGVAMKFELLDDHNYYELKRPATLRHPKLNFIMRDDKVYLICKVSDTDTQYFQVNRFTSCVHWLNVIDRKTRLHSRGGPRMQNTERLKEEFRQGIGQFCPELAGMTRHQNYIIDAACVERAAAKLRSEKLLKEIVAQLGCTEGEYTGERGYFVQGKLHNYFVSKVPPYKVWNHDTGRYICIVNGQHYDGVGYDALVTRLLALANDSYSAEFISTLRAA